MMAENVPHILDFCPLEDEKFTRIHPFFDNLKEGRLTTTKCQKCNSLLWQPRVVCPHCSSDEMEWIELPTTGKLFAFTAMMLGAPMGFEDQVPFPIGVVELDEVGLKILARIEDAGYEELKFDMPMEMKVVTLEDGRVLYRFKPKM
jgi:uncharacterized OB-fold protein